MNNEKRQLEWHRVAALDELPEDRYGQYPFSGADA